MSDNYIKGPWHVRHCDDEMHMCMTAIWASPVPDVNCDQYEDRECSDAVAIVYHQCYPLVNPDGVDEAEARAHLIAAAPDLLAELERYLPVIEWLESKPELWGESAYPIGIATANGYRHVIAKAKGHSL